eukprot:6350024-Prymnesium_polylepis.1
MRRECVRQSASPRIRRESENLYRESANPLRIFAKELVRVWSRTFANPSRICASLVEYFRESDANPWISDANLRHCAKPANAAALHVTRQRQQVARERPGTSPHLDLDPGFNLGPGVLPPDNTEPFPLSRPKNADAICDAGERAGVSTSSAD